MKTTLKAYEHIIPCDMDTPITIFHKYVGDGMGFLLESTEQPKGRYSWMSTNPKFIVTAYESQVRIIESGQEKLVEGKALEIVKEYLDSYEIINHTEMPFVGGAVGTVGYDMIKQYEQIPANNEDEIGTPDSHLMFVTETVVVDHFHNQLHILVLEEDTDQGEGIAKSRIKEIEDKILKPSQLSYITEIEPLEFKSNVEKSVYESMVEKAKQYIYDGDIFQVVLSQRWQAECETKSFELYRKLRRVNPSPYMFYFNFIEYQIAGASPEMLVEIKNGHVKNCPIAGTRKRGANKEEDLRLENDLLNDQKERAEHNMLVDLGRNDMGRIAEIGTVDVSKYMEVHHYSHVMHLVSLVEGQKREDKTMFDVLMSFLPAGTLSGAPKIRAMEIIDELETTKRGIYGGAIGYFGFNGNMDTCIVIRTMVIKDNKVYIQAGAGIVADSDPTTEYEETVNKAKAMITAINS